MITAQKKTCTLTGQEPKKNNQSIAEDPESHMNYGE
jgi:hypothetical protein